MSKIGECVVAFTTIFMQLTTQLTNYHVLICIIICNKAQGNIIIPFGVIIRPQIGSKKMSML